MGDETTSFYTTPSRGATVQMLAVPLAEIDTELSWETRTILLFLTGISNCKSPFSILNVSICLHNKSFANALWDCVKDQAYALLALSALGGILMCH